MGKETETFIKYRTVCKGGKEMDTMKLNNGQEIPAQGFGVFMVENNGPCEEAVTKALAAGYRLLDTAAALF